ncbi:hypothetical protein [Yoonia sp. SS1-5]|uniref:Uncharacterized protein n=1 Tax=Yoonia rhodophyticola TaxID=3137370 RepID=A0AAN0NJX3_9RHOB
MPLNTFLSLILVVIAAAAATIWLVVLFGGGSGIGLPILSIVALTIALVVRKRQTPRDG